MLKFKLAERQLEGMPMTKMNKTEYLASSLFLALPSRAKAVLAFKSMEAPRFAFEIIRSMSHGEFVERRFEIATNKSRHGTSLSLLCLEFGELGLARGLFNVFRKKSIDSESAGKFHGAANATYNAYYEHIEAIIQDRFKDAQILRARSWIAKALCPDRWQPNLAIEATLAFAAGRPLLGLALCEKLLLLAPGEIADQTSLDAELPLGLQDMRMAWISDKSKHGSVAESWRKSIFAIRDHSPDGWRRDPLTISAISNSGLLPLAAKWSAILASAPTAHPQAEDLLGASAKLAAVADALWDKGALTSPSDYVARFTRAPLLPDSPQILHIKKSRDSDSKAPAQALLLAAAMNPIGACGDGQLLWDACVNAHLDVIEKISPNPFSTLSSGQSPALWSLSGNGKLIELGLSRGFRPSGSFSVDPNVASRLCLPHGLSEPKTSPFYADGISIEGFKAPRRGRPSMWEASEPSMSLSTIALISGHEALAKALCAAGAETPQFAEPLAKARDALRAHPEKQRAALEERVALWEAIALGLEVDASVRKRARRFKTPPPPPLPRKAPRL